MTQPSSRLRSRAFTAAGIGAVHYAAYIPPDYDTGESRYPTLYLLHGRGDSLESWGDAIGDLDDLVARGVVPPVLAVLLDAPWSDRAGYYVDSLFTGDGVLASGTEIERMIVRDLVPHIDREFRTIATRESRAVCGYSMGGAGALRLVLGHPHEFAEAIILSPAVYEQTPPIDSSTREFGAYGIGDCRFVEERYRQLNYPAVLVGFDPSSPVDLFIGVGNDEPTRPDPRAATDYLEFEACRLYDRAHRLPGVSARLEVVGGAHAWPTWRRLFRSGLEALAERW